MNTIFECLYVFWLKKSFLDVKRMKEKCFTFCFIKLDAKVSPKPSGEGWHFGAKVRCFLSKLRFTYIVSC